MVLKGFRWSIMFRVLGIENNIYGDGRIVNVKYSNKTAWLCQQQPLLCLFSGEKSIFVTQHNEIICWQMLLTYLKVYSDISLKWQILLIYKTSICLLSKTEITSTYPSIQRKYFKIFIIRICSILRIFEELGCRVIRNIIENI